MALSYKYVLPGGGFAENSIVKEMFDDVKAYVDTFVPSGGAAPVDAKYVTISTNATLSDERVLTGTANQIVITDNGAGSTVVLSLPQDIANTSSPSFAGIKLRNGSGNTVTINPKSTFSNYTLTMPADDGTSGQFLQTDGSGVLSWAAVTTGVTDIHGTIQQITVSATTGSVTLSLPQDIGTTSAVQFNQMMLSGGTSAADLTLKLHDSNNGLYVDGATVFEVIVNSTIAAQWDFTTFQFWNTGPIQSGSFKFRDAAGSHPTVTIVPPTSFTSYSLTLPVDDGTPNQVLTTDGSGVLSWTTPSGTGANAALSNLASVAINTSLLPTSDNSLDLGSSTKDWRTIYVSTSIKNGSTVLATVAELGYLSGVTSAIQTQLSGKEPSITTLSIAKGGTNSGTALSNGKIIVSSGGSLIEGSLGLSGTALTGLVSLNGSFLGLGKNRVVNGDMQFDQRNEGASVALVSNTNTYGCDTFFGYNRGKTALWTTQRLTAGPPSPFAYYERLTITTPDGSVASDAEYVFTTRIEGTNFVDTAFGTASATSLTLSFWIRSSLTGTFGVGFESAASDSTPGQYTINAANTWEYKTITITGDTAGTWSFGEGQIGLKLLFDLGSGSDFAGTVGTWSTAAERNHITGNTRVVGTNGATWDITGIQLELGSTATSFEWKPYNDQIRNVQRFYEKSYYIGTVPGAVTSTGKIQLSFGQTGATTVESTFHRFHVQKAGVPTMTFYDEAGTSGKWKWRNTAGTATSRTVNLDDNLKTGFYVYQTAALEYIGFGHFVAEVNL